jgi:N-methylhydantoinase A
MDPERAIGGGLKLDVEAARNALASLAAEMDMTVEAAALGVARVANSAMVRALRRITVERGIDGRQCALLAYGGAGPMHAVAAASAPR